MKKTTSWLAAALLAAIWTPWILAAEPAPDSKPVVRYPLNVCIVSNEELGSMGDAITYVHGNREVKFCCRKCLKKFQANPDKYLSLIDEAVKGKAGKGEDQPDQSKESSEAAARPQ